MYFDQILNWVYQLLLTQLFLNINLRGSSWMLTSMDRKWAFPSQVSSMLFLPSKLTSFVAHINGMLVAE